MNWIRELCDLYDKNKKEAGIMGTGRFGEPLVLLPMFHSTVTAQITVTVNEAGDFLQAEPVAEEDKITPYLSSPSLVSRPIILWCSTT